MPRKRNSQPKVMTWMKASPVLVVAVIFDAIRLVFEWFWFFGPALAGIATNALAGGGVFGKAAGITVAAIAATAGAPAIAAFGVVMAMAVGLFGWLTIGLVIMMTNARIFKENEGNVLWFAGSLLISEIPIVGSLPGFIGATVKMYSAQIKKDEENLKKYEKETAAERLQEQNQKMAELMQARNAELAQDGIY